MWWESPAVRFGVGTAIGTIVMVHGAWLHWRARTQRPREILERRSTTPLWINWISYLFVFSIFFTPTLSVFPGHGASIGGLTLALVGLAGTIYSRHFLDRAWSPFIEIAVDQRWCVSGPYRLLAHPIFAAELLVVVGAVLLTGHLFTVIFLGIAAMTFVRKARLENDLLSAYLGERPIMPLSRGVLQFLHQRSVALLGRCSERAEAAAMDSGIGQSSGRIVCR